ncbi:MULTISPECIES: MoaD/ThiS family protein [unclassified Oceanobacter]|jgi:thiamine biosynthesis protein ThiS|uniref:sulfur carrier protein ThiS n=1 Tax=unclassified Oceanobacter TaxID=2620260 RepID=UPI0026E3C6DB|nr:MULTISPECIES: MoaD/ThiS family protein [unclassified Oceanobacter]MDO6681469.1 MoaD/ThiS family protein [Oceanobacter sp. 5_MG-2023]MDP2506694.1 MoaD/ThiS family protein [Oceanobacter sp. 3_MG-2023]MDP2548751.1 MoaD/ThiS family protein [Oceanobacter sp. 4_MG-2023]MDP2609298.1 MoaD/ThiS family protein [Oceanobacter sp. 1_MG-2023]MDP2612605.1 MoaD/ThiS family protein [Oceanobacter sp. 2_MG-2023]
MKICLNGEWLQVSVLRLDELLQQQGFAAAAGNFVVAVDQRLIHQGQYHELALVDGMQVDILGAMTGG